MRPTHIFCSLASLPDREGDEVPFAVRLEVCQIYLGRDILQHDVTGLVSPGAELERHEDDQR